MPAREATLERRRLLVGQRPRLAEELAAVTERLETESARLLRGPTPPLAASELQKLVKELLPAGRRRGPERAGPAAGGSPGPAGDRPRADPRREHPRHGRRAGAARADRSAARAEGRQDPGGRARAAARAADHADGGRLPAARARDLDLHVRRRLRIAQLALGLVGVSARGRRSLASCWRPTRFRPRRSARGAAGRGRRRGAHVDRAAAIDGGYGVIATKNLFSASRTRSPGRTGRRRGPQAGAPRRGAGRAEEPRLPGGPAGQAHLRLRRSATRSAAAAWSRSPRIGS